MLTPAPALPRLQGYLPNVKTRSTDTSGHPAEDHLDSSTDLCLQLHVPHNPIVAVADWKAPDQHNPMFPRRPGRSSIALPALDGETRQAKILPLRRGGKSSAKSRAAVQFQRACAPVRAPASLYRTMQSVERVDSQS